MNVEFTAVAFVICRDPRLVFGRKTRVSENFSEFSRDLKSITLQVSLALVSVHRAVAVDTAAVWWLLT